MSTIRVSDVFSMIDAEAPKFGVDPEFAKAILAAENSGSGDLQPNGMLSLAAKSHKGAFGLGQVLPTTKASLISMGAVPADIKENTALGQVQLMLATLQQQRAQTEGDPVLDAAYYNGGNAALSAAKAGDLTKLPQETQQYLQKVGRRYKLSLSGTVTPAAILSKLTDAGNSFTARMEEVLGTITGINSAYTADAAAAEKDAQTAGEQKAVATRATAANIVSKLDSMEKVLGLMGADIRDPSSLIMQQQAEVAKAQQAVMLLRPQVEALRNVSFLDDPLKWLTSQIQLADVSTRYNQAATRFNSGVSAVAALNANAKSAIGNVPGDNKDSILAAADAEAEFALADARFKSFAVKGQVRQAQLAALSTEMQLLNTKFQHAGTVARIMQERFQLSDTAEKDKKLQLEIARVNGFRAMLGAEPWTAEQYKSISAEERTKWLTRATRNSIDVADSPGKAMRTLHDMQMWSNFTRNLDRSAVSFYEELDRFATSKMAEKSRLPENAKLKPMDLYEKIVDEKYKSWRKELERRDYKELSPDNPYRMDASIFSGAKELENNTIAQWALSNPSKGARLSIADVAGYAASQVAAGKPLEQVATEARQFFFQGYQHQLNVLRMPLLGFDTRNKDGHIEYPVSSDLFSWGRRFANPELPGPGDRKLQLFNQADWENFLTRSYAESKKAAARTSWGQLLDGAHNIGTAAPAAAGGSQLTNTPPAGMPSIYASPEEWAAYRQRQNTGVK